MPFFVLSINKVEAINELVRNQFHFQRSTGRTTAESSRSQRPSRSGTSPKGRRRDHQPRRSRCKQRRRRSRRSL